MQKQRIMVSTALYLTALAITTVYAGSAMAQAKRPHHAADARAHYAALSAHHAADARAHYAALSAHHAARKRSKKP